MPNGQPRTPISFPQGARRVIAGWDARFEGMRVGARRRLLIPYQLAYGELGRPPVIPPRAELVFDVELMAVTDTLPRAETAPGSPPAGGQPQAGTPCPAWADVSRGSRWRERCGLSSKVEIGIVGSRFQADSIAAPVTGSATRKLRYRPSSGARDRARDASAARRSRA